ncbi:MAG TPA: cytochrome P450, partial [Polyangiaceae bacterium]|nr:cytochrome P450 [Polyangiaceae bacterium]
MTDAAGQRVPAHARELSGVTGLFHFGRDPLAAFAGAAQVHGDVLEFSQLRGSFLLLSHPQAIEAVLQHRGPEFEKDFFTRDLGAILGQGLLNAEGERWRKKRKLMAPTFQPRELAIFAPTMVSSTDELVASLTSGEIRDVHADAMHLTLDIVARTLFGARVARFAEVEHALAVVATEHRLLWQTWRALLPRWVPLPSHRRLRKARASLDSVL